MILERLIPKLRRQFPDRPFSVATEPQSAVVFAAAHPDVGPVEIVDEGDELTLIAGRFTHGHFSCYEEALSVEEKEEQIAERSAEFLSALFSDQVVLWGAQRGGGGWYYRDTAPERAFLKPEGKLYVWSGPLSNGG